MDLKILDEVTYLFVDQFDNLYGMLVDRTDVRRIRKTADDGLDAIYAVVSSVFGDKLEEVLYGAAYTAMDSIAYEDESWTPKDVEDREMTLDMARLHLEALKGVLQMAEQNGHGNVEQIIGHDRAGELPLLQGHEGDPQPRKRRGHDLFHGVLPRHAGQGR